MYVCAVPVVCVCVVLFLQAEYLGEDGEWYFYYTASEGVSYNLTHVFYATEQDRVNIAKIQSVSIFLPKRAIYVFARLSSSPSGLGIMEVRSGSLLVG